MVCLRFMPTADREITDSLSPGLDAPRSEPESTQVTLLPVGCTQRCVIQSLRATRRPRRFGVRSSRPLESLIRRHAAWSCCALPTLEPLQAWRQLASREFEMQDPAPLRDHRR